MATRGSTNLNRILKVTAHLLFEKGQDISDIYALMQGFVDRSQIERWHRAYCTAHGKTIPSFGDERDPRIPMPPIDWEGVKLEDLEAMKQSEQIWF